MAAFVVRAIISQRFLLLRWRFKRALVLVGILLLYLVSLETGFISVGPIQTFAFLLVYYAIGWYVLRSPRPPEEAIHADGRASDEDPIDGAISGNQAAPSARAHGRARRGRFMRPEMNSSAPLVSIVIPAYNYAHYLDEAIKSVLDQDYPNVELIVLDDGSIDHTREVLEKYGGRFYWETQDNMGQANTLNKGWRMCKGEILGHLSADDVLLPNAAGTSVRYFLANPDAVLTYCDYYLIDSSSSVIRRVSAPEFSYKEMVTKLICPPGPGAFFLRGAYEATGGWDASLRQVLDYDYWTRLGLRGRFVKIPEALASFRVHEESQTFAVADEEKSEEYPRVISDYYRRGDVPSDVRAAKNEALSNAYIFAARSHLRSRRYAKGLARLLEGLSLYPRNLSPRTARLIAHGLLNHVRHRLAQKLKKNGKG